MKSILQQVQRPTQAWTELGCSIPACTTSQKYNLAQSSSFPICYAKMKMYLTMSLASEVSTLHVTDISAYTLRRELLLSKGEIL